MIGIIGYAVPSKSGIVVRELRQKLGIQDQLSIYNHSLGGFDHRWAQNTHTNGFPKSGNPSGRWEWEVQWPDLQAWTQRVGHETQPKITTVVFVGNSFGERSFEFAKTLGLKIVFVGVFEREEVWPAGADLYVAIGPTIQAVLGPVDVLHLPYPIATEIDRELWLNTLAGVEKVHE